MFGIPRHTIGASPNLVATAFRSYRQNVTSIHSFLLGWPSNTPRRGFATLWMTVGGNRPVHITTVRRQVRSRFSGDPVRGVVRIPPISSLLGQRASFQWSAWDSPAGLVKIAHRVEIRF